MENADTIAERRAGRRKIIFAGNRATKPIALEEWLDNVTYDQHKFYTSPTPLVMSAQKAAEHYAYDKSTFANHTNSIQFGFKTDNQRSRRINRHRSDFIYYQKSSLQMVKANQQKLIRSMNFYGPWDEVEKACQYPAILTYTKTGSMLYVDPRTPIKPKQLILWIIPPVHGEIRPGEEIHRDERPRSIAETAKTGSKKQRKKSRNCSSHNQHREPKRSNSKQSNPPKKAHVPKSVDSNETDIKVFKWLRDILEDDTQSEEHFDIKSLDPTCRAKSLARYAVRSGCNDIKRLRKELQVQCATIEKYDAFRRVLIFGGIRLLLEKALDPKKHTFPATPSPVRAIGIRSDRDVIAIHQRAEELIKCGLHLNQDTYDIAVEWYDKKPQESSESMIRWWENSKKDKEDDALLRRLLQLLRLNTERVAAILYRLEDEEPNRAGKLFQDLNRG